MKNQSKQIVSNPFSARVRGGELTSTACPCREVLKNVTSPWGMLLIIVLMGDVRRFSELRRMVGGVSEKMLSQTLKRLEAHGLVHRKSYETVPPHTEYSLTPLGRTVGEKVEALADCIETIVPDIMDAQGSSPSPKHAYPDLASSNDPVTRL